MLSRRPFFDPVYRQKLPTRDMLLLKIRNEWGRITVIQTGKVRDVAWWVIWLIVCGVLLIAEMMTFTFVLLWLAVGAAAAALTALALPDHFAVQVLVGSAVALIMTLSTRRFARRWKQRSRGFRDVIDELEGKMGVVIEDIPAGGTGIVKVGSDTWTATSAESLSRDERVEVVRRGTTVLEVRKWRGEA